MSRKRFKKSKIVKVKGLVGREMQQRFFEASEEDKGKLLSIIEEEKGWMIDKMAAKGYRLEATVAGVLGVFTRGAGVGAIELVAAAGE